MNRPDTLPFTESDEANRLLATNDLALLIGMLLDQQFPMERAFFGPRLLEERLGIELESSRLAGWDLEQLEVVFKGPPAIHRYPAAMAKRTRELAQHIVDEYDGDPSKIWSTAENAKELLKRLKRLPGFGEAKSRIFVGLLGKRLGIRPDGWEETAADWPSIADVADFDDVFDLREQKRLMKQKEK